MLVTKAITVRFYSTVDADLIEMAIKESELSQSEWARTSLILMAETQVMRSGPMGQILKNTLLTRRLIQTLGNFSNDQVLEAMQWSNSEFGKIFRK